MSGFKLNVFSGIFPRLSDSLLPDTAASIAQNCDFAYGELRNTKAGLEIGLMTNSPQAIYTDDGLTAYTWPTDANAVRSPIASDPHARMYYTAGSGLRTASRLLTKVSGGEPGASFRVGVPKPSKAPTLNTLAIPAVNATTATVVTYFHYEYAGMKYQHGHITATVLDNAYTIRPPAKETGTPANAYPVIEMIAKWKADNSEIFDLYTPNSSFESSGGPYSLTSNSDKDATGDMFTAVLNTGIKESDKETRAYVYTFVNIYNEEGPPSPPAKVTCGIRSEVEVTVTKDAMADYVPLKEIRIYRTPTGSDIAEYFYSTAITNVASGTTFTATDNVKAERLNEQLASTSYYEPPAALTGLMSLPNGILCGWVGNDVFFSEAYKPWAWPPEYSKPLLHRPVGGLAHGSGALITTIGHPYLISGVSPDSMSVSKINVTQAGVSKWSIAAVDGSLMYASNDGLVVINGATASLNQSGRFFTREVWRARCGAALSSIEFAVWDGRLVVFSRTNAFKAFMIRVDEADGTMTDLPSFVASCSLVSPIADHFYYATGSSIYVFNEGIVQDATWQSKEIVMATPVNFGYAKVMVTGKWTFELWAFDEKNGTWGKKHTQALTEGVTNFRLPSGYKADRYKLKIIGNGRFRELRIASTAVELAKL